MTIVDATNMLRSNIIESTFPGDMKTLSSALTEMQTLCHAGKLRKLIRQQSDFRRCAKVLAC